MKELELEAAEWRKRYEELQSQQQGGKDSFAQRKLQFDAEAGEAVQKQQAELDSVTAALDATQAALTDKQRAIDERRAGSTDPSTARAALQEVEYAFCWTYRVPDNCPATSSAATA